MRFDEGKIVLNSWLVRRWAFLPQRSLLCSFKGAEWGKEERHSNPFAPGQEFDIRVRAHEDKFEITANQKEIAEFKHRSPLANIDHFQVAQTNDTFCSTVKMCV